MKIGNSHDKGINIALGSEKEVKAAFVGEKGKLFSETLGGVKKAQVKEKLDALLKKIDEQAKNFGEHMNIRDLKKYQRLVREFMQEAVKDMYAVKEEFGWDRQGNPKVYTLLRRVDQSLEDLTKMLLDEQKDNLEVISKMDEIRGMLLDIYS